MCDSSNLRILNPDFFCVSADKLAVSLLGKVLARKIGDTVERYSIAETECYMGIEDTACHAHKGKTARTSTLWESGGTLYVHMIYGLHFMLNIVAGEMDNPMGVLVRGVKGIKGPGRLARSLKIDKSFNQENLLLSDRIWIEDWSVTPKYNSMPRVGIDYADKADRESLWRFVAYEYL